MPVERSAYIVHVNVVLTCFQITEIVHIECFTGPVHGPPFLLKVLDTLPMGKTSENLNHK